MIGTADGTSEVTGSLGGQLVYFSQPDATAGKDVVITARAATTNFETLTTFNIGELNTQSTGADRALIQFDLSSIPSNAVIKSTVLSLYATTDSATNTSTVKVYRLKRVWVENQVTWNIYSTGNNWQTAGGFGANDCEQTEIGSRSMSASETLNVFKSFDLVGASKADLDLGNGWLLRTVTELNDAYSYASSDNATAANRPKLLIKYKIPSAIAGTSDGSSTATATLNGLSNIRGTADGTSDATGHIKSEMPISASDSGTSTAEATGSLVGYFRTLIDGLSTADAAIRAIGYLRGESLGTSTTTGRTSEDASLAGSIDGTSTAIAVIHGKIEIAGNADGISTADVSAIGVGYLSGNIGGTTVIISAIIAVGYLRGLSIGSSTTIGRFDTGEITFFEDAFKRMSIGMFKAMR